MQYLLPLKARPGDDLRELGNYVDELSRHLPVIIVDGSDHATFARNRMLFPKAVHVRPRPELSCANGKVAGVLTGFALCTSDEVLVADDDVRFEPAQLFEIELRLAAADLVCPQNYYEPMSWAARWDTARMLINRLLPSGDFPGTLALRLTPRLRQLGYDGEVLFENLELMRSVHADGGTVLLARDLFVRRRPPAVDHFFGQRVRQAYDSQAQPWRLAAELSLLPLAGYGLFHPRLLVIGAVASAVAVEAGRRRGNGAAYFPATSALWGPLWTAERGICAWIALSRRVTGRGTVYAGRRIIRAATPVHRLRRARAEAYGCRRKTV